MKRWKVINQHRYSYPGRIKMVHYKKGKTLHFDLLGGFVFEHKYDAKKYVRNCAIPKLKIIEVEAIGRGKHIVSCPTDIIDISNYAKNLKGITIDIKNREHNYYPGEEIYTLDVQVWLCAKGSMVYPILKVLT